MKSGSSDPLACAAARLAGDLEPTRSWMDARFDFPHSAVLRKSYVVASSYRCGSSFFCAELWRTGVLGAPGEYVNIGEGRNVIDTPGRPGVMMRRLRAVSPEDYFAKLIACRTSSNGVFGMKAHFHHFEPALRWCPSMTRLLAPTAYVYLNRRDKLAQAVSMAKALQTDLWTSMDGDTPPNLRYDERLITRCLDDIQRQRLGWLRWFEVNNITPFIVNYEDLLANAAGVVRSVVELLDVQKDDPEAVRVPNVGRQSDETNRVWAARFRRDHDPSA